MSGLHDRIKGTKPSLSLDFGQMEKDVSRVNGVVLLKLETLESNFDGSHVQLFEVVYM